MAGEQFARKSMQLPAKLVFGDDYPSQPCIMSEVSPDGAHLSVANPSDLPEKGTLWMTADGKVKRSCTVVTRTLTGVGVKFE